MSSALKQVFPTLRVSVRIDVGEIDTGHQPSMVDVSLPTSSSLDEVLPEVLELAGAPTISSPWMATTVAGQPIDHSAALGEAGLAHGSIIVLAPFTELPPPQRKDAAEALSELSLEHSTKGLSTAATLTGSGTLAIAVWHSTMPTVSVSALFFLLSITMACLTVWLKNTGPHHDRIALSALTLVTAVFAGLSAWTALTDQKLPSTTADTGWALLASLCLTLAVLALLSWAVRPPLASLVAAVTTALCLLVGALSALAVTGASGCAACVLIFCFVGLQFSPALSSAIAGLDVPRLPSAGQDLKVSDQELSNPERRARIAAQVLDGLCAGISIAAAPALVVICALSGEPGFAVAVCVAASAAVLLHAVRHRSAVAMWALWLWALAGIVGGIFAALPGGPGGVFVIIVVALGSATAPLWATQVRNLSPPVVSWIEKFEALALAAVFPLAAHLAGLFEAIRSLG